MKYLALPKSLLTFWYPEALIVWLRVWRNLLLYLEEDLAVGLMARLLFVPLFHDFTVVGRALSFLFRSFRIFIGVFAFCLATCLLLTLALYWFLIPVLAFTVAGLIGLISKVVFFSGCVLFINHLISHPQKKVWRIRQLKDIWQCSWVSAKQLRWEILLKDDGVKNLLLYLEQSPGNFAQIPLEKVSQTEVLEKVWELGRRLGAPYLRAEYFFVATLLSVPSIADILTTWQIKVEDLTQALRFLELRRNSWRIVWIWDEDFHIRHLRGTNRGWLSFPTPQLDLVSEDLTKNASKQRLTDFIGRADLVSEVVNLLSLESSNNVAIVGEPGSGKTTLVEYLAKLIVLGDAPASLATKRLLRLDFTLLLTGIATQGELAARIKKVFEEVKSCGNIIIFIDEIQNLGVGEAGSSLNVYSLLLPFIESDSFQFLATTNDLSYSRIIEKNGAFARLFNKVELRAANLEETVEILKNKAVLNERYQKVRTSILAIKHLVELTVQYIHDRVLPDSALKIYETAVPLAQNGWINKKIIEEAIADRVKIPVGEVEGENKIRLLNLEGIVHRKLVDQEEAVRAVASSLRRAAASLKDPKRPIGSFLFIGPTGVGKTELAKILAEEYFQGGGKFVRLDMSEYQAEESVNKLIGKSGEEGQLTEAVRLSPYSLVLLDEFEKASPKILTIFLQVLEDGRLTDGAGRTVDFTSSIIIATSNAGSLTIARGLKEGKSLEELKKQVSDELMKIFKPELVNRFDEVVLFKPLSADDLQKIVRLKLVELTNRLKDQGFLVEFGEDVVKKLAQEGFDPVLGARPLRRLIQDTLEARLSVMILENKLTRGQTFRASTSLLPP